MESHQVNSRDELIGYIFQLLDDHDSEGDQWENQDIYTYLQAVAAWLNDCEGYYQNAGKPTDVDQPSWQIFADALSAGSCYE